MKRRGSVEINDIMYLNKGTKNKPLPTSINNKMKLMTNIIYQVYGKDD